MSSLAISGLVFACVFGGVLLGMLLRRMLPEHHLSSDSRDTVKVGVGLIGTMAALVLGLVVSSAKSSYDTQKTELTQISSKIALLDRALERYGTDAKEARAQLRAWLARTVQQIWPEDQTQSAQLPPSESGGAAVLEKIQELAPKSETQRFLQGQALSMLTDITQTRWLLVQQAGSSIPTPFLIIVVFWFSIIFLGIGLLSPGNMTVIATMLLCALSVAAAVFLILELDQPFSGIIQISSEPLRNVLVSLG